MVIAVCFFGPKICPDCSPGFCWVLFCAHIIYVTNLIFVGARVLCAVLADLVDQTPLLMNIFSFTLKRCTRRLYRSYT